MLHWYSIPVRFEPLVLGHVRLIMGRACEAMAADLADERLHRQVDFGVLAQVGLGREACSALRAHVRLRLVKRRVASVALLGRRTARVERMKAAAAVEGGAQHQLLLLASCLVGRSHRPGAGHAVKRRRRFGTAVAAAAVTVVDQHSPSRSKAA